MGTLFVDKLDPQSGTSLEIGSSGDTITIPSGATIANSGTATGFGESNTPAFFAHSSANQTGLGNNTTTKVTLQTEIYDTASAFADSRFTVPSGQAGKYIIYGSIRPDADSNDDLYDSKLFFYLNGSSYYESRMNYANNPIRGATNTATISINLSVGDYVEMYGASNSGGSARSFAGGSTKGTSMGGYKLTT